MNLKAQSMNLKVGQHVKCVKASDIDGIFIITDVEQFYYYLESLTECKGIDKSFGVSSWGVFGSNRFKILRTFIKQDEECLTLDKQSERKKKLVRVFSNPETCGDCNFCIKIVERGYNEYLCKPIKEKYGWNPVELTDNSKTHTFCRWTKDNYKLNEESILNE